MAKEKPTINRGKRSVYVPEPLWGRVRQAAGDAGAREGRPVSTSEIMRRALIVWLEEQEQNGNGWDEA